MNMKHTITWIFILTALFCSAQTENNSPAATDTTPFYRMSLEELMNVTITVASQSPMTSRESPGIVTIITADEIAKLGVRDLMQLLQQVPGFDFGVDVEGVIGLGVRGNWAHEGKVLLLWDGLDLNEDLYSTLQFGYHYPVDNIKRVEIIRGPGSSMYGGNAEYAVINVITTNSSRRNEIRAGISESGFSNGFGSHGFSFATGKSIGASHLNLSTAYNTAKRSDRNYTDHAGGQYDMSDQSKITDLRYRMDYFYKGLSVTGMYDNYSLDQRDGYELIYKRPYKTEFGMCNVSAKYEIRKSEKLTITPGFRYKHQRPWSYRESVTDDEFTPFNTIVNKKDYFINAVYDPSGRINIVGGIEYYNQAARQKFDTVFFSNGKDVFMLDNYSTYIQGIVKAKPFNIILGSRYDYNPKYGPSFVPRIGLTKVWNKYHLKGLYSRAFRAPSIENINASPNILPENTSVAEFEAGLQVASNSYLTANLFDITTKDPIIYFYNENDEDEYINEKSTGTRGFEIEYKWKSLSWYADVNYSFYTASGHDIISIYRIPGNAEQLLAFPAHKLNLSSNIRISAKINVTPSFTFVSKKYSLLETEPGTSVTHTYDPALYSNITVNFENLFYKGLSLQASCTNLTNAETNYIQPYNGNHSPLPGPGREFLLKLTYSFISEGDR